MNLEEETVINRNTMKLQNHLYKALKQRDQYKSERDTLIDDLKVLREKNEKLERENEKLRNEYTTLTDHIRLKASANPGVDRYIALVNFIDRLEKGEN